VAGDFTIDYVRLPDGRRPAREFIDSLDDQAAAKVDAFVERLRVYGTRMHGKFVEKLTHVLFELRVKHFDRIFRGKGMKNDKYSQVVQERMRRSPRYRRAFLRSLQQIDLAMLVREMREAAALSQKQLADRVGTTQSVIARLEDAQYTGQSLRMLERIATACGVNLKLRAEKKPGFDREVVLA